MRSLHSVSVSTLSHVELQCMPVLWHRPLIKSILHMHIDVDMASEFMYSDPVIDEKSLVIAVSQSGETIDTLEAVKYAKKRGAKCLSIINVKGSSIARESDYVLYTNAGPRSPLQVPRHTRHSLLYFI